MKKLEYLICKIIQIYNNMRYNTNIDGHTYVEKENYLECKYCHYKSWDGNEGFKYIP